MNDFAGVIKEHYQDAIEDRLELTLTSKDFAQNVDIPNGVTKNIPHVKMRSTGDYTKYTDQVIAPANAASEQITINKTPMVTFAMDPLDEQDNYINIKPELVEDATYAIKARIDGDFFNQALQAKWKYDANGFGSNSGTLAPIALVTGTNQNYSPTFANAKAGLVSTGVNGSKLMLGVDPFVPAGLQTVGMETDGVSKESYQRGHKGTFGGMSVYDVSTLTSSATLAMATNPTANDFVYIKGIKFTFVAAPDTAGDVDIAGSASGTIDNLVAAINGTGTPGATTYIELSEDDRARIEGTTAVKASTDINLTSTRGVLMASSSLTAAANKFGAQIVNAILMEKGGIKQAMRGVKIVERGETKNIAMNTFIYARYGHKVTVRGSEKMCVVAIQNLAAE